MLSSAAAAALDAELIRSGWPLAALMELAGQAVAAACARAYPPATHKRLLFAAGPGNCGGDALVAARHAKALGYASVTVLAPRVGAPLAHLLKLCRAHECDVLTAVPTVDAARGSFDVAVDGVFGFSAHGAPRAPFDAALALLTELSELRAPEDGEEASSPGAAFPREGGIPVVSIDVPSGWPVDGWGSAPAGGAPAPAPLPHERLRPSVLVSLTAPKPCAAAFQGRHFLGGRGFISPALERAYSLQGLPRFTGAEIVVEGPPGWARQLFAPSCGAATDAARH